MSRSAAAGTRMAPRQNQVDDQDHGVRIDYGEITDRDGQPVRHVKVQPNKGADNPTLKALAAKNSHQVLAQTFVVLDNRDPKEAAQKMVADLAANALGEDDEEEAKKQPKKGGKK